MGRYALTAGISLALAHGFITAPHRIFRHPHSPSSQFHIRTKTASSSSSDSEMQAMSTDSSEETSTPLTFEGEGVAYDANNNLESGAENCERGADQKVAATNRASGALEAWLNLGLSPWISERCVELGFNAPTTVQEAALPTLLSGKDAIVQAETGSGKTLAYLLPILSAIDRQRTTTQAIIVVPTRELGLQVAAVAKQLVASSKASDATSSSSSSQQLQQQQQQQPKLLVMSLLEGSQNRRQRAWAWAEPPHLVVANPTTLDKMLSTGGLRYNEVKTIVVDEVDACWDMQEPIGQALHSILAKHMNPSHDDQLLLQGGKAVIRAPPGGSSCSSGRDKASSLEVLLASSSSSSSSSLSSRASTAAQGGGGGGGGAPAVQAVFVSASVPQPKHFTKQCVQRRWVGADRGTPTFVRVKSRENSFLRTPEQLVHSFRASEKAQKLGVLRAYLKREVESGRLKAVIIFFQPGRPLDEIARALDRDLRGLIQQPAPLSAEDENARAERDFDDSSDEDEAEEEGKNDEGKTESTSAQHRARVGKTPAFQSSSSSSSLVGVLHEDGGLNGRASTVTSFRQGQCCVLLATDLAARGLDVPETSHVVQFDMPRTAEQYLHRAGRTGRAGRSGTVLTLGQSTEFFVLERIANALSIDVEVME